MDKVRVIDHFLWFSDIETGDIAMYESMAQAVIAQVKREVAKKEDLVTYANELELYAASLLYYRHWLLQTRGADTDVKLGELHVKERAGGTELTQVKKVVEEFRKPVSNILKANSFSFLGVHYEHQTSN